MLQLTLRLCLCLLMELCLGWCSISLGADRHLLSLGLPLRLQSQLRLLLLPQLLQLLQLKLLLLLLQQAVMLSLLQLLSLLLRVEDGNVSSLVRVTLDLLQEVTEALNGGWG